MTGRTREEAIQRAGAALADALATCSQMTPREQAEAALQPGGPSLCELEDRIRARRGMQALARSA